MKELIIAKRAAKEAGKILLSYMGKLEHVEYKGRRDPVSEADKASEKRVAEVIREAFPAHGFLAEEKTSWTGKDKSARWIVDPLDGTVNYAHGYPHFSVSIAFERDGEMQAGVVFDPVKKDLFSAVKGGGAFLNNTPIQVSGTKTLIKSLIVTGFPYDIESRPNEILEPFNRMVLASQGVRRDGSAALNLCYLACGRFDGYWEFGLKPWDTAAGALILREAGGIVTDFKGTPFKPEMQEILASNGKIQKEMMEVLEKRG
jgi:myo-inositol-1(or 4)-monophosphatase